MAVKVNKSSRIRALLKQGLSVAAIAKKVGVSSAYVYTVRWHEAKKKDGKVKAKVKAKAKPVAKKARKAKAVTKWTTTKPSLKKADMKIISILLMQINDTLRGVLAALSPQVEIVPVSAAEVTNRSLAVVVETQDSPVQGDLFVDRLDDEPEFDIPHEDRDAA